MENAPQSIHVAIGIFDGIHQGHRALLQRAVQNAQLRQQNVTVLTFDPHPRQVLQRPHPPQLIYPLPQRRWLLHQCGCQEVVVQKFTPAFAYQSPERFFAELLHVFPTLTSLYVGEDFHFGKHGCGDTATLQKLCKAHSLSLSICPFVYDKGKKISSTRIRQALQQSISEANRLLGQPYHCVGRIQGNVFHTHHPCWLKEGKYACSLQNKQGVKEVCAQVSNGCIRLSNHEGMLFLGACCLSFERDC